MADLVDVSIFLVEESVVSENRGWESELIRGPFSGELIDKWSQSARKRLVFIM